MAVPGPAALASRPPPAAVRSRGSRRARATGHWQGPCRPMGRAAHGAAERLKERHKYNQVLRSSGHDVFCENTSTATHSDSGWPSGVSGQPPAAGPLPVSKFQILSSWRRRCKQPRAPKPRSNVKAAADVKFANVSYFNRRCVSLGEKPGTYST